MRDNLKVALVRCGGGVCGVSSTEESLSNAGIIFAPFIKLLAKDMNAKIHVLGPIQKNTENIINGKYPELYKDYFKNITIPESVEQEPEDVDLILIDSGSDNLRLDGRYLGHAGPTILFVYRILKKYPRAKVLLFQTDFAAPFPLPNHYDGWYHHFYDTQDLFSHRKFNVICAGNNVSPYINYRRYYKIDEVVKIHQLNAGCELHSIIDLDDIPKKFEVSQDLLGVGFAGKERISGSRGGTITDYMLNGEFPFTLAGKWSDGAVKSFSDKNKYFKFRGKLKSYIDVLSMYNILGSTIYISAKEYSDGNIVTSRFYDAIAAKAIPFINEKDYDVVASQFGEFRQLCVTPQNIKHKIQEMQSVTLRANILDALTERYLQNKRLADTLLINKVEEILSQPHEMNDMEQFRQQLKNNYRDKLKYSRGIDKSPEGIQKLLDIHMNGGGESSHFFQGKECKRTKMHMGIWFGHQNETSMEDVPENVKKDLNNLFGYQFPEGV